MIGVNGVVMSDKGEDKSQMLKVEINKLLQWPWSFLLITLKQHS
jgi:hypothetical protein